MNDAISVVERFFGLVEQNQAASAVALLAPDVVWRNTGLPTVRGRKVGGMLLDMERRRIGFRVDLHHVAADGDVVLTERTDHLTYRRWTSAFWVCGTFEVRDGLITLWDDHFSPGNVLGASLKGLLGAIRR
jgi:limonene-1,2-epoxide hydrolase